MQTAFEYEVDVTNNNYSTANSSFKGYIETTYDKLVEKFGEPIQYGEGDKVTVEWVIDFIDNETFKITTATIYDWKQYEEGTPYDLYNWHIGGFHHDAVDFVKEFVGA